jgi:glycerophosphoryl diester phosphodiesterase
VTNTNRRFQLSSILISTLLATVLVMFAGVGAQAAGACGSTALAHRGFFSATIDENTIESIERAHAFDAYTENDVFLTADGEFLIIHNQSLRHTTNCEGDVKDRLMADIQSRCHTTPNRQALPTALRAFMTLAGNPGQVMNLEVKGPGWFANNNARLVALTETAARAGVLNRVYFSNDATYRLLTELHDSAPDAKAAWKPDGTEPNLSVQHARELSADVVMALAGQWARNRGLANDMKNAGIDPWAKRIEDPVVWENNWRRGIEVQLTNKSKAYRTWCNSVA